MKSAALLADALGVNVDWLLTGRGDPDPAHANVEPGPAIRGRVPVLSWVEAGKWREAVTLEHPDAVEEWIETTAPAKSGTFALRVSGDSMEPEFCAGTLIIVEPDMEARPGDYVVAANGSGEATMKQLTQDGPDWYLKPLNDRYPIKPLGDAEIVGVVVAQERRYR